MAGPCRFLFDPGRKKRAGACRADGGSAQRGVHGARLGLRGRGGVCFAGLRAGARTKKRRAGEPDPCGEKTGFGLKLLQLRAVTAAPQEQAQRQAEHIENGRLARGDLQAV